MSANVLTSRGCNLPDYCLNAGMKVLPQEWFAGDATSVGRNLLGKIIAYGPCSGIIVETEAYTTDAASHGRVLTDRSRLMHETHGHWYVYLTYGMHHCVNVTTNKGGVGAVLIRAVEPIEGIELMQDRRGKKSVIDLCSGPGKVCQAFGITLAENGLPVDANFGIYDAPPINDEDISSGPRIGIKRDTELPWRFWITGNPNVSR